MGIRFGPSGKSEWFFKSGRSTTLQVSEFLHDIGLNAYEYSFGRGIQIGQETAKAIADEAKKYDIHFSVHAPYYINLAVADTERKEKNIKYFLETARGAKWLGAKRAVFHPGSCSGLTRAEAMGIAKPFLKEILDILESNDFSDITFCIETLGKINQLGDLDEIIEFCKSDERVFPAVDFGHLHARGIGAINSKEDYVMILDKLENGVGGERYKNMHVHFSKIEFTKAGEKMHRQFSDEGFGPDFQPLAELLYERKLTPIVICESREMMMEDALAMKQMYEACFGK